MKKNILKNKYFMPSIFIILVSLIVQIPMFSPNFNIQYDDGIQHICRLIGTYDSLKEGQIFPVIMSKLCNNFGYSWNLFYSPITAYIPLIFKLFGCSFEMCLKMFMLALSILSGFAMFFFMKKILQDKLENNKTLLISTLAAILYILSPYRLNDMYLRLAVSELASFIFIPIIFNGLYSVINLKQKTCLLILGAAGMLLTHSMITAHLAIFCIIYLIVNIKKINKKTLITLLLNGVIILLLTAFYWVPLLESKMSANYEVFKSSHMIRWDAMVALKSTILELLLHINGRMFYGLGIVVIVGILLSFMTIKKIKEKGNYILFLTLGLITTIMSLDIFPFEKLPSFFTMLQFSFRMLEFSSFFLVVVSSIALGMALDKFNVYTIILLTSISIILLLPNMQELHTGRYYSENQLVDGIRVTQDTGRVHAGCASFEYLTDKGFENKEYIEKREDIPIILNEKVKYNIEDYTKEGTNCSFRLEVVSPSDEEVIIELPYMYYIGYNVKLDYEVGEKQNVTTFESENGFVAIKIPSKNVKVNVKYTGTLLMKVAYMFSLLALIALVVYTCIKKNYKNNVF